MTDTKPTLEEQIDYQQRLLENYQVNPVVTLIAESILASLKELQSIRSAELPVEPDAEFMRRLRDWSNSESFWENRPYGTRLYYGEFAGDYIHRGLLRSFIESIDALKSYALKEKERADWYEKRKACAALEQDEVGAPCGYLRDMTERAEKAESELAALRGSMKDPTAEMCSEGQKILQAGIDDPHHIFTAMSAVALKEGK